MLPASSQCKHGRSALPTTPAIHHGCDHIPHELHEAVACTNLRQIRDLQSGQDASTATPCTFKMEASRVGARYGMVENLHEAYTKHPCSKYPPSYRWLLLPSRRPWR